MERTLILLKPDTVKRGIIGEIITRFEKAFYRQVMKVKGYKPHKGPKHKFFIDDVEVSESEWYAR